MARIFSYSGRHAKISLKITDKAGFFEHFSIETFTDRRPIFIDVSVNENDFAKCSVSHHLLNHCT